MTADAAFFCYARKDHQRHQLIDLRNQLQDRVRDAGDTDFSVFMDESDIEYGERWKQVISVKLREARVFFAVVSQSFFESDHCVPELLSWNSTSGRNGLLVAIYIEHTRYMDKQPPREGGERLLEAAALLRRHQLLDARDLDGKALVGELTGLARRTASWLRTAPTTSDEEAPAGPKEWNRDDFRRQVRKRSFVPVLGADIHAGSRFDDAAKQELWQTLEPFEDALGDDPPDATYRFMISALPNELRPMNRRLTRPRVSVPPDEQLAHLHVHLSHLGAHLTSLFGEVIARGNYAVEDVRAFYLPIASEDLDAAWTIRHALFDVADAAKKLKELRPSREARTSASDERLGADNLYSLLVLLAIDIFPDLKLNAPLPPVPDQDRARHEQAWMSWRQHHEQALQDHRQHGPQAPRVGIRHLEWVRDTLWHAIRFDLNAYPTDDELAFQLRVMSTNIIPARVPPHLAAYQADATSLQKLFKYFRRQRSDQSDPGLHRAIATYLLRPFSPSQGRNETSEYASPGSRPRAVHRELMVAFVTSFDRELEAALLEQGGAYNIVMPAVFSGGNGDKMSWLLGTQTDPSKGIERDGERYRINWDRVDSSLEWRRFDSNGAEDEDLGEHAGGPVIVYLHGCPLIDLQKLRAEFGGEFVRLYLSLPEQAYFTNLFSADAGFPGALKTVFNNRNYYFIGLPPTSLLTRLRFYQCAATRSAFPSQHYYVGREIDLWLKEAIQHLKVGRANETLDNLRLEIERELQS